MRHNYLPLLLFLGCLVAPPAAGQDAADAPEYSKRMGRRSWLQCRSCHALKPSDPPNVSGPSLCGVLGRTAGTTTDFKFSEVVIKSKLEWTREELDKYVENPAAYFPGVAMAFAGIKDPIERYNLLEYVIRTGTGCEAK